MADLTKEDIVKETKTPAKPGRARKSRAKKPAASAEKKAKEAELPVEDQEAVEVETAPRAGKTSKPKESGAKETKGRAKEAAEPKEERESSRGEGKGRSDRREGSEYSVQTHYDRSSGQFVGSVLEFPEIKVTGSQREKVTRDLEAQLEQTVKNIKKRSDSLPESLSGKEYPETLGVTVSQGLYRKLDRLSRSERVDLDRLVVELLSGAVEKRFAVASQRSHQKPQHQHHQKPQKQQMQKGNSNKKHGANNRGGGGNQINGNRKPQGKGYHQAHESQDNFLEYVRNLEKGKWNKR